MHRMLRRCIPVSIQKDVFLSDRILRMLMLPNFGGLKMLQHCWNTAGIDKHAIHIHV